MVPQFANITYSALTECIANTIFSVAKNIGSKYNDLPKYHTDSVYNYSELHIIAGLARYLNIWLDGNNSNYERIIYNHLTSDVLTIKEELDKYLIEKCGVSDINSNIKHGSFLALVHNLVTFISNRIVIHTSQMDNGAEKYVSYDSYIDDQLIINDTKMEDEDTNVTIPNNAVKLVEKRDFLRIIDSLFRLMKKSYRFSGTYYNFNLLTGATGSRISLNVYYFGAGRDKTYIENNTKYNPFKTWSSNDPIEDYSIETLDQTDDFKFIGWKTCILDNDGVASQGGDFDNELVIISDSKITLKSSYLVTNGSANSELWNISCIYEEKLDNNIQISLSSDDNFSKEDTQLYSANMIGQSSISYHGCSVKIGNNKQPVQYNVVSDDGDFNVDSNGIVTCKQPGIGVVTVYQPCTRDIKKVTYSYTLKVISEKLILSDSLFTFTPPSEPMKDDESKNVPVFSTDVVGIGNDRTIRYSNTYQNSSNPGTWSSTIPVIPGKWYCKLYCDTGSVYLSGEVFNENWYFIIPE